ncbi:MAG: AAA family ATPase [Planctomycetes bacterium]|nr:AAA family ATPase [Planctomycetota bacterium]
MDQMTARPSSLGLILLMGIQAAGKTTFRQNAFSFPHTLISLDEIGTGKEARAKEAQLLGEAIAASRTIVVDNTNPTRVDRARYIEPAKASGYRIVGYYFASDLKDCIARNAERPAAQRVPEVAIRATIKKLERPAWEEGYDELYYVRIDRKGGFAIQPYRE